MPALESSLTPSLSPQEGSGAGDAHSFRPLTPVFSRTTCYAGLRFVAMNKGKKKFEAHWYNVAPLYTQGHRSYRATGTGEESGLEPQCPNFTSVLVSQCIYSCTWVQLLGSPAQVLCLFSKQFSSHKPPKPRRKQGRRCWPPSLQDEEWFLTFAKLLVIHQVRKTQDAFLPGNTT